FLLYPPIIPPQPTSTLFPYTTLFRSRLRDGAGTLQEPRRVERRDQPANGGEDERAMGRRAQRRRRALRPDLRHRSDVRGPAGQRSEEHTSELQSRSDLVCRLLLEKKK